MYKRNKGIKLDNKELSMYQLRQYNHDIIYHSDIVALGMVKRLTHVALHLSKYAYGISLKNNSPKFRKDYIDAFVMVISASNILNLDLSYQEFQLEKNSEHFLCSYLYFSSIFSKSCESYDHFEEHSFHESWKFATLSLFKLFEENSISNNINIIDLANKRLDVVENRIASSTVYYKIKKRLDQEL